MNDWHCAVGNTQYGPISMEQLLGWIEEGRVGANDLVWREGMAQWQPASSVPELASHLQQAAQPIGDVGPGGPPLVRGGQQMAGPWQNAPRSHLQPHRGGGVLTLGILGLACCVICGIIAWVMGSGDLKEMDAGQKDPAGRGMTQAGMICGIISVALWAVGIIFQLIIFAARIEEL